MRKTWPHNPNGFERNSWNYRILQLRSALGWSQVKIARVMGVHSAVVSRMEVGTDLRPKLDTIRRIKALESAYEDILKIYKTHPRRYNRLHPIRKYGVHLNPIEIRRPEDIETLGKVETDSEPLFFGRGSRRKMSQTGMSLRKKIYRAGTRERIALARAKRNTEARAANEDDNKTQSG